MKKILALLLSLVFLTGCSEFALLSSGTSIAISNNTYAKAYSGIDFATTITTKKDIKTHAYHYVKTTIEQSKKVNDYVFEKFNYPIKNEKKFTGSVEKKTIYKSDDVLIQAVNKYSNQLIQRANEVDWYVDDTMFRMVN